MANLEDTIDQAISDFDDIEAAIEEQGVNVPYDTNTSEYGNLIRSIKNGGNVDQTYNSMSENAQSGKAVEEAVRWKLDYAQGCEKDIDSYKDKKKLYIIDRQFQNMVSAGFSPYFLLVLSNESIIPVGSSPVIRYTQYKFRNDNIFKRHYVNYNTDGTLIEEWTEWENVLFQSDNPIKYVESLDTDNLLDLFSLESGTYVLMGKFRPYPEAPNVFTFSKKQLVSVSKGSLSTCVQIFYPPYNTIQYLNILPPDEEAGTGYTYERKDAKLYYMEDTRNMTNTVDENSDDTHYPSAKAVYDSVKATETNVLNQLNEVSSNLGIVTLEMLRSTTNSIKATASGEIIRVNDVSPLLHNPNAKVIGKNLVRFPFSDTTKTTRGATFTVDENTQSVTVTGTPEVNVSFAYTYGNSTAISVRKGETYTASCVSTFTGDEYIYVSVMNNGTAVQNITLKHDSVTFTAQCDGYISAGLVVREGNTYNHTIHFQLEKGDTATEYEPYINPSTVRVRMCGKNIMPNVGTTMTGNGITFTVNNDGSVTCNGTATKNAVINLTENYRLPLGTYRLYGCPSNGSDTTFRLQTNKIINGNASTGCVDVGGGARLDITEECQVYSYIVVLKDATVSNVTFYPQLLLEDETDTTYEPYEGDTYTPNENGTLTLGHMSPIITLLPDTAGVNIELEYNQDTNKALRYVNSDISELDKVTAELATEIGDIDTALDNIIAIQNSLIGGDET